jgi:hypothetical protein
MTNIEMELARSQALGMIGCGVYHDGEFGTVIEAVIEVYAVPMVRVAFGSRIAILKPSEIGANS